MQPIRDTVLKVVSSVQPAPEVARDDAWVKAQKENVRRGLSRRAYEDLRIPPRYARKSLANFEGQDEVKEGAVSALYNANIFLWGHAVRVRPIFHVVCCCIYTAIGLSISRTRSGGIDRMGGLLLA